MMKANDMVYLSPEERSVDYREGYIKGMKALDDMLDTAVELELEGDSYDPTDHPEYYLLSNSCKQQGFVMGFIGRLSDYIAGRQPSFVGTGYRDGYVSLGDIM